MRIFAVPLIVSLAATAALADGNDLVLARLSAINAAGDDVIPDKQAFRSLTSELGVALAPKFLAPSETLGYSGFQFSAELALNTINAGASYWCATEESSGCGGASKPTDLLPTVGIFARKGIWLPLPSFEIGAGAVHLGSSHMWAAQTYAKFALHEGYNDWPLPSLAVRAAASRLLGSEQLDLTVASADISISKGFAVQGTFSIEPYAGWNYLWIVPRSEVIDKTPNVDANDLPGDVAMNFVFPQQSNITRQRVFGGIKVKYYVFAFTAEVNVALAGSSVDDVAASSTTCDAAAAEEKGSCDAVDKAGSQKSLALSVALDF